MPAVKTKRISTLIETQLPAFISDEYELFSKFVQKYYEAQEVQGGTLDVINNIQKYADIDFYEKSILKQHDVLAGAITNSDTTITVTDAQSFPKKNGYIRIDDEIIFYATRTDTEFQECSRGVSGNTSLGDLYEASNFTSTDAAAHVAGQKVYNVSNLFLYALVKNFEKQYLGSFPEKYLRGEVDKRTLIKNIQKFYKSKGTKSSIQFIFNTIVSTDGDKPETYKPRDFTYKSSNADWISNYALKCKIVSGDPKLLIGKPIIQAETTEYGFASATVDNVQADGTRDGEQIFNIILAPETVNGDFFVSTKTKLARSLSGTATSGNRINVFSTNGWGKKGSILIGEETIEFDQKNATQFIIKNRQPSSALTYPSGTEVYKPVTVSGSGVTMLVLGIVYNLETLDTQPYSSVGDKILVSNPGFETADPKIIDIATNQTRWLLDSGAPVRIPTLPAVAASLNEVTTNVTSIHEDDQYYYITSSGYPSHKILDGSLVNDTLLDQNILRLIRKEATTSTERYQTPKADTSIFLNGVRGYSYRDTESIRYGVLEEIKIDTQGRGYNDPPFVLVDQVPSKAIAVLAGQVVESIIVNTTTIFPKTPTIEITSGRGAVVRAVVTGGKVTSLQIDNPGEYYSTPPIVRITDMAGRGRFASFTSIVNAQGELTGFETVDEGNFYNQNTVKVDIIPVGEGASANPLLKEWNFNRYAKIETNLDTENGYVFPNYNNVLEHGYGYVANPKALRVALSDNINSAGTEPANKTHSPILGFAYDGNPIYGPFGHENPLDVSSPIVRMTSSYGLNNTRSNGPNVSTYPLGSFVNDYTYTHKSGSLDENNGRFCITPEFPKGTYAYFLTIDSNQVPQFPYILGANFYSLPVDSNYNSNINQNDVPKNAKRYYIPGMPRNGEGFIGSISDVTSGTIDAIESVASSNNFSVNNKVYFNNLGTEGSEAEANVSSVKGKVVDYLQSKETKVVKLTTIQTAYLFENDTLRQPSSGAFGEIVGTVRSDNTIVLKNVNGTFDTTGTFSADIKTFSLLLDQDSSYTEGATVTLTNGIDPSTTTAEILEGTNKQNVVKIKVTGGTWGVDDDFFLQSSNLFDTIGSRIIVLTSLSDNLEPFEVNQSVALVETTTAHGLGIGDKVDVDINPDDATKNKTYYVRKRIYQTANLLAPEANSTIDFTGIGRFEILNGGADYTAGTYNNIALTGGSGTGATASITVSDAGIVSSVQLQNAGSGYAKGDYLAVADEDLVRSGASQSTQRLVVFVDHVGFAAGQTQVTVKDSTRYADGDLISIGSEVLEISSISGQVLTVIRGREGTTDIDHYNDQPVTLYKPKYNFSANQQIFTGAYSGYIQSYDRETQSIVIFYDYATETSTANALTPSSSFFDVSSQNRLVSIDSVGSLIYKFEFSEDNTTFTPNPDINVQEFYKYTFDTSHSSLTGTYFDMSPSKSYNLKTLEKTASTILPGNPGAFTDVKFGFGARLASNNYSKKVGTDFTNFYYFDNKGIVNAEGKSLRIITDPLQGVKTVNYVTSTRFVYDIDSEPLWDGSGSISYTTTGQFAVGEINSYAITNLGLNYKKVPVIDGVDPNEKFRATATVLFDQASQTIVGIDVTNKGSNYSNPKVIITNGDGVNATFKVVVRNGEIFSIVVDNPGKGYTFTPEVAIVEGDVEAYVDSTTIGIPRSISITNNGGSFHLDKTVSSTFSSNYIVTVAKNNNTSYRKGEIVTQTVNGVEVFRATVTEWRKGSNLLKLRSVTGIVRENVEIRGAGPNARGTVRKVYVTTFSEDIASFYDNIGYFKSDRGRLGVSNQKVLDSYFYQDYSYVVKSKTPIDQWRELIKSTTHPAGFQLFGQVDIEATAATEMPAEMPKADHFTILQLWDPQKNRITVENTTRVVTQTLQKVENQRIRKAQGSAAASEFLFNEMLAFEVRIFNNTPGYYDDVTNPPAPQLPKPWYFKNPFTGYYDGDGRLQGKTTFDLRNVNTDTVFTPYDEKNLIVTLDGVLQDPGVSYTVSGSQITFSAPPLGANEKQTGEGTTDVTKYGGVNFYAKYVAFKDNQYNDKHFRKLKNIYQRNGRWIDAANQIERNTDFIIDETIGYARATHPSLDWATKTDDYQRNIRSILEAYDHDLRFGGNIKTIDYTSIFNSDSEYLYIQNNRSASTDIFSYATRLAKLAIRNWDYVDVNITYIQGSTVMNVSNTDNIAIGMYVSSGRAYPEGTKVVSIDSDTQITLSRAALANSAGSGGVPAGNTPLSGSGTTGVLPTSTASVAPGNTFSVPPGQTVSVGVSFSGTDQATFSWSNLNNGTFYDAGTLINLNRSFIISATESYRAANVNTAVSAALCEKLIGRQIDDIVYHLRYGGNQRLVQNTRLDFWVETGYPDGEIRKITANGGINSLDGMDLIFDYARDQMILAMRNLGQVTDPDVLIDNLTPVCADVESSLMTFSSISKDIMRYGPGYVVETKQNLNRPGNWAAKLTYSNIHIIGDPILPVGECDDVVSATDSLFANVRDILEQEDVTRSLPDFIDGETKDFELYWDNGSPVNLEEDENLFLTINAVLQRPKYTENYPLFDAYFIDRSVIPNLIKFDVAPIWDQDLGAKSIGEPTAVEKVVGIGVGNYKRLTIDYALVNGVRTGPFLILDVEDNTVQNIESEDNLYVFLDGVLQQKGERQSYTISGPNIFFNVPIQPEVKIDMRYLYGRDVGQILNIYDYAPDTYFARAKLEIDFDSSVLSPYQTYSWMGDKIGSPIHVWQVKADGTYNVIGEVSNLFVSGNTLSWDLKSQNANIDETLDLVFGVKGYYNRTFVVAVADYTNINLVYKTDELGRKVLEDDNALWSGTFLGKTYRSPFLSLSSGDQIRVEGEDGFRKIKRLPQTATSKDGRPGEQLTDDIYGAVSIETYTGITRGEGLAVVATIENGSVVSLTWNQRSYDPLTQPTAYQYYTPPVLKFIPKNGNGGGARANVLVAKGQVISVDLIDGGSGYTEAPQVIVSRRFDILSERDIGVSLVTLNLNTQVQGFGMNAISFISEISDAGLTGISSGSSVSFGVPTSEIDIERVFTPDEIEVFSIGGQLDPQRDVIEINSWQETSAADVPLIDTFHNATVVSAEVQDIVTVNSISTVSKAITTTIENLIPNDALSNVNFFETAAYLQVDLAPGETVVYIPDTTKFDPNGFLLIGDEVVFYSKKLNDRFIKVDRAQRGTTEKGWLAGTFIRQIPELVSVAFGGVLEIQSESDVTMVSAGFVDSGFERKIERQVTAPEELDITKSQLEIVLTPPPGGVIDGYEETAFITDPVIKRDGSSVDLIDVQGLYYVLKRDTTQVQVVNSVFGVDTGYIGQYTRTNVGHTISMFDGIFDDGVANASGLSILEFSTYFPAFRIEDFTKRAKSSYTIAGAYFNLLPPSIQNPVAVTSSSGTIPSTVQVQDTTLFPTTGYVFTSGGSVIQYTGKTSNSFTGCTHVKGPTTISNGQQLVPHTIT